MKKTIREMVEFFGTEDMRFAMKSDKGISPREYYTKDEFFKEYGEWADEIPCEWFPHNFEKNGIWHSLFIIK